MLYIVSTPIGNLDDISYRQAKTIVESDIVLAEDTRSTFHLIKKIADLFHLFPRPNQRLISYYKEKEFEKLPEMLELLHEGKIISLISESGTPVISDPGLLLVQQAIKQNILYTVIPGPSSITTALIHSGFNPHNFCFLGFLPKKSAEIFRLIESIKQIKNITKEIVFVFFESAVRLPDTLKIIDTVYPDANICICREMTKMFEETLRGHAKDFIGKKFKGEITVVIK